MNPAEYESNALGKEAKVRKGREKERKVKKMYEINRHKVSY